MCVVEVPDTETVGYYHRWLVRPREKGLLGSITGFLRGLLRPGERGFRALSMSGVEWQTVTEVLEDR